MSEASTVAEAISGLGDQPDWILLDLMLPDGCGIDVLQKIQAESLPTRVCIITGCGNEMIGEAIRAGAEHAFIKPLDVERLMTLLSSEAQPAG